MAANNMASFLHEFQAGPNFVVDPIHLATNIVPVTTAAGANTGVPAPANPAGLANLAASALQITAGQPGVGAVAGAVVGSAPLPTSTAGPAPFTIGFPAHQGTYFVIVQVPGDEFAYRERVMFPDFMAVDLLPVGLNEEDAIRYRQLYESVTVVETIRDQLNQFNRHYPAGRAYYEQMALDFVRAYGLHTWHGTLMTWTNVRTLRDYASRWGPELHQLEERASAVRIGAWGNDQYSELRRMQGGFV